MPRCKSATHFEKNATQVFSIRYLVDRVVAFSGDLLATLQFPTRRPLVDSHELNEELGGKRASELLRVGTPWSGYHCNQEVTYEPLRIHINT